MPGANIVTGDEAIASVEAARHWVDAFYESLNTKIAMEQAFFQLGRCLASPIVSVRLFNGAEGVCSVWQATASGPSLDDHPHLNRPGTTEYFQSIRGDQALTVHRWSGSHPFLLVSLACLNWECSLLVDADNCEHTPQRYITPRLDFLFFVLPQIPQAYLLMRKLNSKMKSNRIIFRLLQQVPLPLLAIDQSGRLLAANRSAIKLVQRVDEGLHRALVAGADSEGFRVRWEGSHASVALYEREFSARHLFDDCISGNNIHICILKDLRAKPDLDVGLLQSFYGLSNAEINVCEWVLMGHEPAEIADIQSRSINTIKSQLRSIYKKTGVASTSQLATRLFFNPAYWVGRERAPSAVER